MLIDWLHSTARELGFADLVISKPELSDARKRYLQWISAGYHGEMAYMARHGELRFEPSALVPETVSVITVIMPYLPAPLADDWQTVSWRTLDTPAQAYISRYAHGRDYHKIVRARLQKLADALAAKIAPQPLIYRAFSDSAPVPEVEIAQQTRLGWRGKHTLTLSRHGSWHFLGEIYTDLALPVDAAPEAHCGRCSACITACPTGAIVAPYRVDARRCISYLTIELKGAIPEEFRPMMGNRIYGCDDCQLACPWNRFARKAVEPDFAPRHGLDRAGLVALFHWSEADFTERMAGSPIYRIGYERWSRNLAVALGNAQCAEDVLAALALRREDSSPVVREHVRWALGRHDGSPVKGAV